mmetsp:Transcript_37223/g.58172  ORF Transcript_37223/g.58172 Transcript_37223/m.58172 type:complete len:110 (-) Transcript_37223:456-785(-)|eukprot:CAMPEP_0184312316 /NCGR_PEP_ID=MMETSP1049-20130417/49035_1 /TAXON_ID=77928 /ORGANISM="Proteomonas sulcata, Strain CCMP704" /LENGTH=109 /DNA_ID=CAMNT_0026628379 /DNA_START=153 /DNA_END=482 /DNA_ORIENTATION=-
MLMSAAHGVSNRSSGVQSGLDSPFGFEGVHGVKGVAGAGFAQEDSETLDSLTLASASSDLTSDDAMYLTSGFSPLSQLEDLFLTRAGMKHATIWVAPRSANTTRKRMNV